VSALTALVIEDNDINRDLLVEIFREKDFLVAAYSNALDFLSEHGLEKCSQQIGCFDFILTDNRLPEMNGLEFLARLDQLGCKVPMHRTGVISGEWSKMDLEITQRLGYRVFHKPGPVQEIFDWIDEAKNEGCTA